MFLKEYYNLVSSKLFKSICIILTTRLQQVTELMSGSWEIFVFLSESSRAQVDYVKKEGNK